MLDLGALKVTTKPREDTRSFDISFLTVIASFHCLTGIESTDLFPCNQAPLFEYFSGYQNRNTPTTTL